MENNIDVMLDLETLGTKPGAHVMQIAMVAYNNQTFDIIDNIDIRISKSSMIAYGLKVDMETLRWWFETDFDLYKKLVRSDGTLEDAIDKTTSFYIKHSPRFVWCHPDFDAPILKALYDKLKYTFPFKHKTFRDVRTAMTIFKIKRDFDKIVTHNAIDDCIRQIGYLKKGFLGGVKL